MENHPHDSICGCSIDPVHDEMKVRFDQVEQMGEELTRQSLERLALAVDTQRVKTSLQVHEIGETGPAIVVFNPSAFARREAVTVELDLPPGTSGFEIVDEAGQVLSHETIGLGTQYLVNTRMTPKELRSAFGMVNEGRVMGLGVRAFTAQREGEQAFLEVTFSQDEPDKAVWERGVKDTLALLDDPAIKMFTVQARTADRVQAVFCAPETPGLGWRTFAVRTRQEASAPVIIPPLARALLPLIGRVAGTPLGQKLAARLQRDPANQPPYEIENEFFKVAVEPEGTLAVTDKRNGRVYRGLNRFVDGGDNGDEYNYSPPPADAMAAARLQGVKVQRGVVRQSLTLSLALRTPTGLSPDRQSRSAQTVECPIQSVVTLTQGVARVDVRTVVDNRAKDHRLRVHFPTSLKVDSVGYDGHFEVTRRPIGVPAFNRETWVEDPRPEAPQRAFIDVSEESRGLTLANRGLPEVEAIKTESGVEIALTLLRCVGWLSRDDYLTRRGHAGPAKETPGAQMPGSWAFEYSICPHLGQKNTLPHELAYAFETPLRAVATPWHAGSLPGTGAFLAVQSFVEADPSIQGDFIVSAVKAAEDGRGWVVRGYNPGHKALQVMLKPLVRCQLAELVNLAEQKQADLALDEAAGSVSLMVKNGEIVSVRLV